MNRRNTCGCRWAALGSVLVLLESSVSVRAAGVPRARVGAGEFSSTAHVDTLGTAAGTICTIDSSANCQAFTDWDSQLYVSDRCFADNCLLAGQDVVRSLRVADDFVADASGNITSVCVKGAYLHQPFGTDASNCGASRTPEKFQIVVYDDDNGFPGAPVLDAQTGIVASSGIEEVQRGKEFWRYQFSLATPIPVQQGRTYWLEVSANTDGLDENGLPSGDANCDWLWAHSDTDNPLEGNGYAFQNNGQIWDAQDLTDQGSGTMADDLAWCIDVANFVPPVPEAACCACAGSCDVAPLADCNDVFNGIWIPEQSDCGGGFTCPTDTPDNDECLAAMPIGTNEIVLWDNFCASDNPFPLDVVGCGVTSTPLNNDIWFEWIAPATANYYFTTCFDDPFGILDTVLAVYSNGTATCPCPPTEADQVDCSNDGCNIYGGGSEVTIAVEQDKCYLVRIGGNNGAQGNGAFAIASTAIVDCFAPNAVVPDAGPQGSRYITFDTMPEDPGCPEKAIRVRLTALDGFAVPADNVRWVGEPFDAPDGDVSQPDRTFRVAPLACDPVFRDWSDTPEVSVFGGGIVPRSTYTVDAVFTSCLDLSDRACYSTAVEIETGTFGDVVAPFAGGGSAQPDFGDIAAQVSKFLGDPTAPPKKTCQLRPQTVFPERPIDFNTIAATVDAFLGAPYASEPFGTGPCACPSLVTCGATPCTTDAQCSGGLCVDDFCRDACRRCTP